VFEREKVIEGRRGRRGRALRKKAGSINDINQQYLRPSDRLCSPDKGAEEQPVTRCVPESSVDRQQGEGRTGDVCAHPPQRHTVF